MADPRQINAKINPTKSNQQVPIQAFAKLNVAGNSSATENEKITLIVDDTRFLIDIGLCCFIFILIRGTLRQKKKLMRNLVFRNAPALIFNK